MRAAFLALALVCALPAGAAGLDLEIAPGWTWSTDVDASAPALHARAGWDLGWFTPSLSAFAAPMGNGGISHRQSGGIQAWGFAAELRVHTPGPNRLFAALGAGLGQLLTVQSGSADAMGYEGFVAPYVEGAAGYQRSLGKVWLGLALTVDVFNRVHEIGDLATHFCVESGGFPGSSIEFCPTGRSFPMVGLALTLSGTPAAAQR